jgi:hypothetical protein
MDKVLEIDTTISTRGNPKFRVELNLDYGWLSAVELMGLDGRKAKIIINYDTKQLHCKWCLEHTYFSSQCTQRPIIPQISKGRGSHLGHQPHKARD